MLYLLMCEIMDGSMMGSSHCAWSFRIDGDMLGKVRVSFTNLEDKKACFISYEVFIKL